MPSSHPQEKDIELMLRIKDGDKSAFEELYHLYKIPVSNFLYRLSGNQSLTEDCLQEVFYRIWFYRQSYIPRSKVITYIFQISKNYWINEGKRLKRKPVSFTTLSGGKSNLSGTETVQDLSKDTLQEKPDEKMLSQELKETIQNAINRLPEKERLVLVMSQYQDLKYAEIAEILDIAEITVKTRMAKALDRLKKYLNKYLL